MRKIFILQIFMLLVIPAPGQTPVGSWSDHLIYTTAKSIAVGTKEVFASTGSSIIVYNKEYSEVKKITRINGLTETGISTIGWSEENKSLIIAYTNSNVDLLINNKIHNIPDIYRKYISGKKEINRIRTQGKFAYLACSFGIVVVDLVKLEIYDTWKPGDGNENPEIWDVAIGDGKIFAATDYGVFSADLDGQGLSYFGNWSRLNILPDPVAKYSSIVFSGNKVYANRIVPSSNGDSVYAFDGVSSLFSFIPGVTNKSFEIAENGFTISSPATVRYFNDDGSLIKTISTYGWGVPNISHAIIQNDDIWIADVNSGLIRGENLSLFSALTLPGPASTNAYNITSLNGKTIICNGGADISWNNQNRLFQLSMYENKDWNSISETSVKDAMRAVIDPDNSSHIFVSSWGGGLLEYKNNILEEHYTEINSHRSSRSRGCR